MKDKCTVEQFMWSIKKGIYINLTLNITLYRVNEKTKFKNKWAIDYTLDGKVSVNEIICTDNLIKEPVFRIINRCIKIDYSN